MYFKGWSDRHKKTFKKAIFSFLSVSCFEEFRSSCECQGPCLNWVFPGSYLWGPPLGAPLATSRTTEVPSSLCLSGQFWDVIIKSRRREATRGGVCSMMFHSLKCLPALQCTDNIQSRLSPMLQMPHCCRSVVHTAAGLPLLVLDPVPAPGATWKKRPDYEHLDKVKVGLFPCIDMPLN